MKNKIKNLFRRIGIEPHRYNSHNSQHCATKIMFKHLGVSLVFDVGANAGQYAAELFDSGFKGKVISFEPVSSVHKKLCLRAKANPGWIIYPRAAVGASKGEIAVNVSANTVSSSALPMLKIHSEVASESRYVASEIAPTVRLDDIASSYLNNEDVVFLKIDAQGYESQVIAGASDLLRQVSAVQLELALVPLYEGQSLWREYVDQMESLDLQLYFLYPAFTNSVNGQTLQMDAMFVRRGSGLR